MPNVPHKDSQGRVGRPCRPCEGGVLELERQLWVEGHEEALERFNSPGTRGRGEAGQGLLALTATRAARTLQQPREARVVKHAAPQDNVARFASSEYGRCCVPF